MTRLFDSTPVNILQPSSMMLASTLLRLPYEVLERIFDEIDSRSLASACLGSRGIYEIASRNLYGSLLFVIDKPERSDPLYALKQRPHLAMYTHKVTLRLRILSQSDAQHVTKICDYIRTLPSIRRIEWFDNLVRGLHHTAAVGYFLDMLMDISSSIVELRLPPLWAGNWKPKLMDLRSLRDLTVSHCFPKFGQTLWYRHTISNLESLTISTYLHNAEFLRGACSLRTLKLQSIWSLPQLYPILSELSSLKHLSMLIDTQHLQNWTPAGTKSPTFTGLECLELALTPYGLKNFCRSGLFAFIRSLIAEVESLQEVQISSQRPGCYIDCGNEISGILVRKYRHSLRLLALDAMRLQSEALARICQQCPNLEVLGFIYADTDLDSTALSAILNLSPMLKTLRLTVVNVSLSMVVSIMSQDAIRLRKILLRTTQLMAYFVLESRWTYDPELRSLKREI
ncbi:hypothetical protein FS842_005304, partial [Serendipita sp. 407]